MPRQLLSAEGKAKKKFRHEAAEDSWLTRCMEFISKDKLEKAAKEMREATGGEIMQVAVVDRSFKKENKVVMLTRFFA